MIPIVAAAIRVAGRRAAAAVPERPLPTGDDLDRFRNEERERHGLEDVAEHVPSLDAIVGPDELRADRRRGNHSDGERHEEVAGRVGIAPRFRRIEAKTGLDPGVESVLVGPLPRGMDREGEGPTARQPAEPVVDVDARVGASEVPVARVLRVAAEERTGRCPARLGPGGARREQDADQKGGEQHKLESGQESGPKPEVDRPARSPHVDRHLPSPGRQPCFALIRYQTLSKAHSLPPISPVAPSDSYRVESRSIRLRYTAAYARVPVRMGSST